MVEKLPYSTWKTIDEIPKEQFLTCEDIQFLIDHFGELPPPTPVADISWQRMTLRAIRRNNPELYARMTRYPVPPNHRKVPKDRDPFEPFTPEELEKWGTPDIDLD